MLRSKESKRLGQYRTKCGSENDAVSSKNRGVNVCEDPGHEFGHQKPFAPLRVFLSYGHDSSEDLVRRIKADLEARHDVWFDESEIKFHYNWRLAIMVGSQTATSSSLLSRYSTRDAGVCLDEIASAIGVRSGNIQTILVRSEQEGRHQ